MRLIIDRKKEKIYILAVHSNGKIIEKRTFWSFETLRNIVNRKIALMYLVTYHTRYLFNNKICFFDDIFVLRLKSFEEFLNLLETGAIFIYIKCGVYSYGPKEGLPYDHGTAFQIKKNMLHSIFVQKK